MLVTRRHPDLLEPDQSDLITVAVAQWERHRTTTNAYYLVTANGTKRSFDMGKSPALFDTRDRRPRLRAGGPTSVLSPTTPQDSAAGQAMRNHLTRSLTHGSSDRCCRSSTANNITRPDRDEVLDGACTRLGGQPQRPQHRGGGHPPVQSQQHDVPSADRFHLFAKPGTGASAATSSHMATPCSYLQRTGPLSLDTAKLQTAHQTQQTV